MVKPAAKRQSFTGDCLPIQAVLAICLPVKSIASGIGDRRLPLMTVSRAGLITDERHIAPKYDPPVIVSAQYRMLHSAPYDIVLCRMSVYASVSKNTVQ